MPNSHSTLLKTTEVLPTQPVQHLSLTSSPRQTASTAMKTLYWQTFLPNKTKPIVLLLILLKSDLHSPLHLKRGKNFIRRKKKKKENLEKEKLEKIERREESTKEGKSEDKKYLKGKEKEMNNEKEQEPSHQAQN